MEYLSYQFSLFGNFQVSFSSEESIRVQKKLSDAIKGVSFYQTLVTNYNVDVIKNTVNQSRDFTYVSEDNSISISFSSSRVDLNFYNKVVNGYDNYKKIFTSVYNVINGKPNRLALNTVSVDDFFDKADDNNVLLRYIIPIEYYNKYEDGLDEWMLSLNKTRIIALSSNEKINVITQLSKTVNNDNPSQMAIMWRTDINTDAGNLSNRFDYNDFVSFIDQAVAIHNEVVKSGLQ